MTNSRRLPVAGLVAAILLAACAPIASPRSSPVAGRDWGKAPSVERPPQVAETVAPQFGPHPQHCLCGQADLQAVTTTPTGFVAVGYLDPDIVADAWTSPDGLTWTRIPDFPASPGSLAASVASGDAGVVAVGSDGTRAAAWFSSDGTSWQQAPDQPSLGAAPQVRFTAVTAVPGGFVAGGYVGSLSGPIRAAFWRSADGVSWERAPDSASFADARVAAVTTVQETPGTGRLVAVGAKGDAQRATGPAAWVSDDGIAWRAATIEAPGAAVMNAVARGPVGLVAVGNDADSMGGISWSSTDGVAWSALTADPALQNGGSRIQVLAVTWAQTQFVAGGHRNFGTQRGTAVIWTSPDGRAWTRAPETVALGEGKLFGIAAGSARVIAVGSVGAPDYYLPTVWVSPPAP